MLCLLSLLSNQIPYSLPAAFPPDRTTGMCSLGSSQRRARAAACLGHGCRLEHVWDIDVPEAPGGMNRGEWVLPEEKEKGAT